MKKQLLLGAIAFGLSPFAMAGSLGIGFDNVGIDAGHGLNMTLPGGRILVSQRLGSGYAVSGSFEGAGGKNNATFYGARVGISKALSFDGGTFTPGLNMGWQRLNAGSDNLQAAYGGVNVTYRYPLTRAIDLKADVGFGRDFCTSVTGIQTIGGLTYNAGAQADFHMGPGWLDAGYAYRHLPLSTSNDLHLITGQFTVGYRIHF